jgi:hypothetical protein
VIPPLRDGSIHGRSERFDNLRFARFEMSVEATMREPAGFIKSDTLMPSAPA